MKLGLASTNYTLFSASFSCVGHLIKRVTLQEPTRIKAQCNSILPIFIDRLGDQKGRISAQAVTVLVDMYKACPVETEKAIKELAMVAKSPKVREQSLQWMVQVYRNVQGFSFRSYTPLLMKLLEDADPSVRDLAKEAVVEMFK